MIEDREPLRLLLGDDHPLFRAGLRALLEGEPGLEVVAEADDGEEVVELALRLLPDLVVMDLRMPRLNGIDATREIVSTAPSVRVLVLTMHEDDDSVFAALRAGASGYLLKGARPDEVLHAVHAVAGGAAIFGPALAQRMLESFALPDSRPPAPFPELTAREREVLELVASGSGNWQIAAQLALAPKTVRNNISNILTKLQVTHRAQAIVKARDAGMGRAIATGPRPQDLA